MRFMNDFDLQYARQRFDGGETPNRQAIALLVDELRDWADENSDGWAYWPKPCRAAARAIDLIASTTYTANQQQETHDATDEEVRAAIRPIKAFLTRQGATPADRERILSHILDNH